MDLISREAIHEKEITNPENDYEYGWNEALAETDADIPSAFEGMTNGEVIQAMFPNSKAETISFNGIRLYIDDEVHTKIADFTHRWWNAPYKAESEGKAE